ncbi:LOW QUALITY PROTEIN: piRNA biogenesis protein EXD1 [Corvus kubaryi]|uniref:LOW QUALITY PROTEIN: piRNA biogenesis protein EXD1 n=1 Tax=Corvus kubaryi TaxID=68294 RepID=UPI001C059222|nr:LOW QUALITY PROTEIN: piRNA biogenesis protein EXD1 [Corvus kubaryi]
MSNETANESNYSKGVEVNKQTDTGPADCGLWSSPCVSLESHLRASDRSKYSLWMYFERKTVTQRQFMLQVMHGCQCVSDCLFHQYSVLQCLGYTGSATVLQFSVTTGGFLLHHVCTLQVKIPSKWDAIMKCRQLVTSENPDIWFLRPFLASLLKAFVLKAIYLLLLHSSLMDNLMSDLTAYLNAYWTGSGDHHVSAKPICMELPEEQCQLADIQKLRRKKAIEDYKMNEDGLLIKPWNLIERNNPQKDGNYRDDGYCFPTKNSRVPNHILQQSRMYFVKAELENQIYTVKSVEGP